ncbi:hypothetical protein H072_874 [Dactylellina haptotyla CBS 200.50]|uniref:Initiation-specific alpha-1,6-mannosyltransferase n=1 Tax=Dactylellina haptotyla (strain CBS 200.50) TaxID=1284197 RepID=S8C054_DACHA|nr:hypothetical protein H072_874 [Dactylellina haptotyla CBS 200.50]
MSSKPRTSSELRREVFRGMYNPIYRNPHPAEKADSMPKTPISSWIRMPRRHSIVVMLNFLLLCTFIYHLPKIPHQNFLPTSLTTNTPTIQAAKPSHPSFYEDKAFEGLSKKAAQAHLQKLAKTLTSTPFPKHIYQTWKSIALPSDDAYHRQRSWSSKNPSHEYTLLTDATALKYVEDNFNSTDPFIVHLFANFPQRIVAADLLRYLIAYKSGGLYTDIDTECNKPIDTWLPQAVSVLPGVMIQDVNIVIGMELDIVDRNKYPDAWVHDNAFLRRIQFLQWSIYAKPGHEIPRRMVTSMQESVRGDIANTTDKSIKSVRYKEREVLDRSGPFRWTKVVLDYINQIEGREVPYEEFSGIKEAKKFGDVLFLAVNRMSPGVPHSDAGPDETSFLIHHFSGSWRDDLAS